MRPDRRGEQQDEQRGHGAGEGQPRQREHRPASAPAHGRAVSRDVGLAAHADGRTDRVVEGAGVHEREEGAVGQRRGSTAVRVHRPVSLSSTGSSSWCPDLECRARDAASPIVRTDVTETLVTSPPWGQDAAMTDAGPCRPHSTQSPDAFAPGAGSRRRVGLLRRARPTGAAAFPPDRGLRLHVRLRDQLPGRAERRRRVDVRPAARLPERVHGAAGPERRRRSASARTTSPCPPPAATCPAA